jgi:hypothetical protein
MDPDPDPTPDPTPFFNDFKDVKKNFFSYFFFITYPQVHHLQSLIFCELVLKLCFFKHYFSPLKTFMRKRKEPDPGGPKTCGSCESGFGSDSGSPTASNFSFFPRKANLQFLKLPLK